MKRRKKEFCLEHVLCPGEERKGANKLRRVIYKPANEERCARRGYPGCDCIINSTLLPDCAHFRATLGATTTTRGTTGALSRSPRRRRSPSKNAGLSKLGPRINTVKRPACAAVFQSAETRVNQLGSAVNSLGRACGQGSTN